jgi:hypothetical protein
VIFTELEQDDNSIKAARTNEEKDFKMFTATAWAKQN